MRDLADAARLVAPRRGRPPGVNREQVLEAALALVDREGLAALTMRGLAGELGVAVSTVYAAASSKEEILAGLADHVLGDLPVVAYEAGAWRGALAAMFREVHERLIAHPAIAQLSVLQPLSGPRKSHTHDQVFEIMASGGIDEAAASRLYTTLASYVTGYTLYRARLDREIGNAAGGGEGGHLDPYLTAEGFTEGLEMILRGVKG